LRKYWRSAGLVRPQQYGQFTQFGGLFEQAQIGRADIVKSPTDHDGWFSNAHA